MRRTAFSSVWGMKIMVFLDQDHPGLGDYRYERTLLRSDTRKDIPNLVNRFPKFYTVLEYARKRRRTPCGVPFFGGRPLREYERHACIQHICVGDLLSTEGPIDVFANVGANTAYSYGKTVTSDPNGMIAFTFTSVASSTFPPSVAAGEVFELREIHALCPPTIGH
ncbi:hypothetical protein KP509_18G019400 [Ceratopteris richardii]|uniref:Uncharacterized protein n=1 Tax=Ceratopteris richardii TaxID=49495 RepID=A0A8T2SRM5_CERRI|nr:hypothetical protein KP509_18G019400 [Ceratopteris richardii]